MNKPILLWPKAVSDIEPRLGQAADAFMVVDTNSIYDLQKLSRIGHATAIFDPFPRSGQHYREYSDHVAARDCRPHIVGLKDCQSVLDARRDPSLAKASIEELVTAMAPALGRRRHFAMPVGRSWLNWSDMAMAAILVFAAALVGNALFLDNSLIAAVVTMLVFTVLYAGLRAVMQAAGARAKRTA
jgi:hypothetical protein